MTLTHEISGRSDTDRLRAYAEQGDEQAFGEIVSAHLNLVYSTALRQLGGDAHRAQDISQTVFVDLATLARSIPQQTVVSGWLYRHTCYVASKTLRTERRRLGRELIAMDINDLNNQPSHDWKQIAAVLDSAMTRLGDHDRNAIVLRFFEQKSLQEVGAALGLGEDAARMKVSRALDRLRKIFARYGITTTSAALAAALPLGAAHVAPHGFAAAITAASLAAGIKTSAIPTLTILKVMASTKLKLIGVTAVAAALMTPIVLQNRSIQRLRAENRELRQRFSEQAQTPKNETTAPSPDQNVDQTELVRLRAEVVRLKSEVAAKRTVETRRPAASPLTQSSAAAPPDKIGPYEVYNGDFTPEHIGAIKTMKLVGLGMRLWLQDSKGLSEQDRNAAFGKDVYPKDALKKYVTLNEPELGQFEILTPNLAVASQLESSVPGAIIARSIIPFPTADGRWVRIYGRADGSIINLIHDSPTKALEFGELENSSGPASQ